jgi:16S rRNA (cytidine1402-2'-O)-methyltransferase
MALFVVATPIGNLEDLSFRALRTLREVDLIAAEDTRRTAKLLAHYEIRRSVVSLREHNEARETPRLIARLERGQSIALVSDAGTPGISDPGTRLVRTAHEHGITVIPIPGPTAIAAALSASGFPADEFVFMGFPPRGGESRQEWFSRLADDGRTVVFFESPHRIRRTLAELHQYLVNRQIFVAREVSKLNEQLVISPSSVEDVKETGEFTVVVGPAARLQCEMKTAGSEAALDCFWRITNIGGFDELTAIRLTAVATGLKPTSVRKLIKKRKILAERQSGSLS